MTEQLTVRLPRTLHEDLKRTASRMQRKPSEVVRLAFAIGAIFSGFGPAVILYVVLWVVMPLATRFVDDEPEDGDWRSP